MIHMINISLSVCVQCMQNHIVMYRLWFLEPFSMSNLYAYTAHKLICGLA